MVVSRYPASIANYFTYDFYTAVSSTKKKCIETPIGEEEEGRGVEEKERNEYTDTHTGCNRTNEGPKCDMNALMHPLLTATRFVDSTLDPLQGRAIDSAPTIVRLPLFFFHFIFYRVHFSLAF